MRAASLAFAALLLLAPGPAVEHVATQGIEEEADELGTAAQPVGNPGAAIADRDPAISDRDAAGLSGADVDEEESDGLGAADAAVDDHPAALPDRELHPAEVAPARWTDADVRAALAGQSVMTRRIVFCEVGRSGTYDPYAVGSRGEIGPAQLLPGCCNGLAIFYRWGFSEPNNPHQAVAFINRVQAEGMLGSQYPRTSRGCAGSP